MKMTVEDTLQSKHGDYGKFGVGVTSEGVKKNLIPLFYLAILKSMRDSHTRDFYKALEMFTEDDMDKMHDFFEGGEDDD